MLSSTLPPVSLAANLILPFGYPMATFALDSLRAHLTLVSVLGSNHMYPLSTSALRLILMKSSLLAKLFQTDTTNVIGLPSGELVVGGVNCKFFSNSSTDLVVLFSALIVTVLLQNFRFCLGKVVTNSGEDHNQQVHSLSHVMKIYAGTMANTFGVNFFVALLHSCLSRHVLFGLLALLYSSKNSSWEIGSASLLLLLATGHLIMTIRVGRKLATAVINSKQKMILTDNEHLDIVDAFGTEIQQNSWTTRVWIIIFRGAALHSYDRWPGHVLVVIAKRVVVAILLALLSSQHQGIAILFLLVEVVFTVWSLILVGPAPYQTPHESILLWLPSIHTICVVLPPLIPSLRANIYFMDLFLLLSHYLLIVLTILPSIHLLLRSLYTFIRSLLSILRSTNHSPLVSTADSMDKGGRIQPHTQIEMTASSVVDKSLMEIPGQKRRRQRQLFTFSVDEPEERRLGDGKESGAREYDHSLDVEEEDVRQENDAVEGIPLTVPSTIHKPNFS